MPSSPVELPPVEPAEDQPAEADQPLAEPNALRAAVAARATKTNFAPLARDLGISSEALHGFSTGQTSLPPDVLKALASQLWGGHVEFTEPKTITPPPPIDPESLPDRWQPWKTSGLVMPEQLRPPPPPPRPGWVEER